MAGAGGIEPPMTGSKPVALTAWRRPSKKIMQLLVHRRAIYALRYKPSPLFWQFTEHMLSLRFTIKTTEYARTCPCHQRGRKIFYPLQYSSHCWIEFGNHILAVVPILYP